MKISTEKSAFDRQFAVRYRLPRPISRSYESALYARDEAEIINKIEWCAGTAVRFVAALRQALYLSGDPGAQVGAPGVRDFKQETSSGAFSPLAAMQSPVRLLQHAGAYSGAVDRSDRASLLSSLEPLSFLTRYRIACVEREGVRVLLGPRMEYLIWAEDRMREVGEGTPLLVDTETGEYLTLRPLALWRRRPSRPLGSLLVLRSVRGDAGRYVEDGVPGSPAEEIPLEGRPRTGRFDPGSGIMKGIRDPGTRYPDGLESGDYAVEGVIWKGSMSDIYLAWNSSRNAPIVLKTYERRGSGFDENYWHFINEEKYAREPGHPGVVKPSRVTQEGLGLVYEQDFIGGGSLGDVLEDRGVMPLEQANAVGVQLLHILDDIHAKGIAHNDIKPDNILFDTDGGPRIIDFGIARSFIGDRNEAGGGVRVGTEGYIAPELMAGGAPSARSDLYSFGVVFAQMLCGRMVRSHEELAAGRMAPVGYLGFFMRCLAENPAERFASARAAAEALAGIVPVQERAITLDIEGTLVTDYGGRHPRPGLFGFIEFCLAAFDRIFIYTSLSRREAEEVLASLHERKAVPGAFMERCEYVDWPRGADGTVKDLRRCGVPIEYNAIVDDMGVMIPDDQRHRWVPVPDYSVAGAPDSGFFIALADIRRKFALP
ncbi:MAG: protein kinase [Spirochaetes bacterium]|nr:protein kinase [Spirochaetota bacterium]